MTEIGRQPWLVSGVLRTSEVVTTDQGAQVGLSLTLYLVFYTVLDGFDLGVGLLLPMENEPQRTEMISSTGPFWDANKTWLVLAIGLLLIVFPEAHSPVLRKFCLPSAFLLIGLILRGVSFDFRAKAVTGHQRQWDYAFKAGSLMTSLTLGYMLGCYVLAFQSGWVAQAFALLSGVCVTAAFAYIGGAWLVIKSEGELQRRAVGLAGLLLWA